MDDFDELLAAKRAEMVNSFGIPSFKQGKRPRPKCGCSTRKKKSNNRRVVKFERWLLNTFKEVYVEHQQTVSRVAGQDDPGAGESLE